MKLNLKTLAVCALAGLLMAGAGNAATMFNRTVNVVNDPFPGSLDGSPSLAKCDMESEGNIGVDCNIWDEGASAGTYTFGATAAFNVDYTSEKAFNWSFVPGDVVGELLYPTKIAVKTGAGGPNGCNCYHVYDVALGDTSDFVDLTADLVGLTFGAISHVSFYDTGRLDTTPVPLPAAGWLLLAGVGGLAAMRRRKKA